MLVIGCELKKGCLDIKNLVDTFTLDINLANFLKDVVE
jgi:hypothetical protein